jgi:hypothetical protein
MKGGFQSLMAKVARIIMLPNSFEQSVCRRGKTTYAIGWLKWGPN